VGALLFVCVLAGYLFSFTVDQPSHNGDWYIRYQVTCAIVEHNTYRSRKSRASSAAGADNRRRLVNKRLGAVVIVNKRP